MGREEEEGFSSPKMWSKESDGEPSSKKGNLKEEGNFFGGKAYIKGKKRVSSFDKEKPYPLLVPRGKSRVTL